MIKKFIKKQLARRGFYKDISRSFSPMQNALMRNNIPLADVKILDDNNVVLNLLNLKVDVFKQEDILRGYKYLLALVEKNGAKLLYSGERIVIEINNCKAYINTWEEINILNEIYVGGVYNLYTNGKNNNNYIFVDIGMNVGLTSLFFANNKNVERIYSFEPFDKTYENAIENINLNPHISKKITVLNIGLSDHDRTETWSYNSDYKGSMGVNGLPAHIYLDESKNEEVEVQIKDVAPILKEIMDENPDMKYVMKMDCEGSEYQLIPKLHESGLLEKISVLMIEWHVKGPKDLLTHLDACGFSSFSFFEHDNTIGMLYCIK